MAESERAAGREREELLPENSILSLEEYLAMQRSIGNETRFRIVDTLVGDGPQSASELRERLEVRSNTLHYHLEELIEVGLVENRKRKSPDRDGLYSYYRATSLGEGILSEGVRKLMAREWDALETYGR
ncbi:winged helix-turn-helix domain-containing protein [Halostagnicola kamekurae]|uniref:Helix-turn-helix domain-containing protein n=1 Tax=Halostagnicola kamekurae TaxID=619731 RepID=A0A1I6RRJ9_9EURY|nr:helix-turn-helix domain-containing protein [Halostagnicola kamekurae]SFS67312.1 Helix-turn-helix domain-containing protein [Halostagnicola kamekurae]